MTLSKVVQITAGLSYKASWIWYVFALSTALWEGYTDQYVVAVNIQKLKEEKEHFQTCSIHHDWRVWGCVVFLPTGANLLQT